MQKKGFYIVLAIVSLTFINTRDQPGGFPASSQVVIGVPAETTHNLQVSAGIGYRF